MTQDPVQGTLNGSNKAATLMALAGLGLLLLVWSIILPVIGILYLSGGLP